MLQMYSCCGCVLTVVRCVAIGNAYAVLSNSEKRRHYDQYGEVRSGAGRRRHSERDFQPDISPEDLFNMFFGGGFPSSEYLCVCLYCCTALLDTETLLRPSTHLLCTMTVLLSAATYFHRWLFFFHISSMTSCLHRA